MGSVGAHSRCRAVVFEVCATRDIHTASTNHSCVRVCAIRERCVRLMEWRLWI